jgi:hypothetical protein
MNVRAIQAWVYPNWPYAGLTASLFLLAVMPLLWSSWNAGLLIVFLQLPIYMIHQVEEHHRDRFRTFVNEHVAGGRNALTVESVVVINLGGVWAVDLIVLYLAHFVRPGLGLIAIYVAIVNAFVHAMGALVLRAYNPGLVTALLLLLPAGCWGWWILAHDGRAAIDDHLLGAGIAILLHAAIVLFVILRLREIDRLP